MTLALYNATFSGVVETNYGQVSWTSFAHATLPILVIDITTYGSENVSFLFEAAPAISPRNVSHPNPHYVPNPPASSFTVFFFFF